MPASGTEIQVKFTKAYAANGGNGTAAAIEAGYKPGAAAMAAYRNLRAPLVHEMIMLELTRQKARCGAIGLGALVSVAESETAPAAAKVAAGRALIEFAGLAKSDPTADAEYWRQRGEGQIDYKQILDRFAVLASRAMATPESEMYQ